MPDKIKTFEPTILLVAAVILIMVIIGISMSFIPNNTSESSETVTIESIVNSEL